MHQDLGDGRVSVLVFVDIDLDELQHLLDADAGVTENFDGGNPPQSVFFFEHDVELVAAEPAVTHHGGDLGVRLGWDAASART